jgi:hypothetical protein
MPNALSGGALPPQPAQDAAAGGNGLAPPMAPVNGSIPQQAAPPPPTHEQTVAALRHFDAIKNVLAPLLQDPALGRSDLKSKIIDGVTKLVSERIMPAETAVDQLTKVPSDPLQQRKVLQTMMQNAINAEHFIVEHHRNTNLGSGDWATEVAKHTGSPDNHMDDMKAIHANYSGGAR